MNINRILFPVKIAVVAASGFLLVVIASIVIGDSDDDFVSLFDGKTLNGWHLMNGARFIAEDGVIKLDGGKGWLRSDKQYSDFVLKFQFRFLRPVQDGGLFFRASQEGDNWPDRNYEVQIENTRRMAMIWGAEYELNATIAQIVLNPDGGWNEYHIRVVGTWIEIRLNGELVCTSNNLEDVEPGYIGLQGENGFHQYRNILIKDLD